MLTATVLATASLGACGAGGADPAAGPAGDPTAAASAAAASAADDAATCAAYGDVLTIVENADLGLAEGRMAAQEQRGWYELATRVLDRLPSDGDGAVRSAVAALQEAVPEVPTGTAAESTGVGSPAWAQAEAELATACEDAGAPLSLRVFTGG